MIESAELRRARAQVLEAPADRHGCIRVRRQDVLGMLDVITAQDEALDEAHRKLSIRAPTRFADRLRLGLTPIPAPKRRA